MGAGKEIRLKRRKKEFINTSFKEGCVSGSNEQFGELRP